MGICLLGSLLINSMEDDGRPHIHETPHQDNFIYSNLANELLFIGIYGKQVK
jgi:hypothetical protein